MVEPLREPRFLLASTMDGDVVRAVREGAAWKTAPVFTAHDVRCLAADARDPGTVYAGTQGDGVWRSTDGGASWSPRGLDGHVVKALAPSPAAPGLVWAGLKPAGVAVTRDGGASWDENEAFQRIPGRKLWWSPAEAPGAGYVQALAASPTDADVAIAGIEVGGVVSTTDAGASWHRPAEKPILDCHALAAHATEGAWFYQGGAGLRAGASVSRDGGRSWRKAKAPGEPHYGWAVAADPADPEIWYFTAAPGSGKAHGGRDAEARVYRVRNGDDEPEALGGGLPVPLKHMAYGLATFPGAPGHAWLALANGDVWHTADHGDTWQRLDAHLGSVRYGFVTV